MKIKITSVASSKKNRIWIQAEVIEGETPRTEQIFNCEPEQKEKDHAESEDQKTK